MAKGNGHLEWESSKDEKYAEKLKAEKMFDEAIERVMKRDE